MYLFRITAALGTLCILSCAAQIARTSHDVYTNRVVKPGTPENTCR